jgi:nicotinamide mononucleotide transporter
VGVFLESIAAIAPAEWVAVAFALGYLLLAVRQNPWCWACAIVSSAIYAGLFARAGLTMQVALQVFYVGMGIYGWRAWRGGVAAAGVALAVARWPARRHATALALIVFATLANGRLLAGTDGGLLPYVDALVAWTSVLATWLVARKVLENWLYWIAIDSVAAALYWSQGFQATAVLFVLYVLIALRGYRAWRRDLADPAREVRALLRTHPATQALAAGTLVRIHGGLSNEAWYVDADGARWFVRRGHPDAARLGVDRTTECAVLRAVADAGLAPALIACDAAAGLLVTHYVTGAPWTSAMACEPANQRRMAHLLGRLHALPAPPGAGDVSYGRQARHLEASLPPASGRDAALADRAARVIGRLEGRRVEPVLCHHDLHHLNVLDDGTRLWLVDWEYAGRGDPLMDVAGFLALHELDAPAAAAFVESYGRLLPADRERLDDARWLFDYVQWLWYRVRHAGDAGVAGGDGGRTERLALKLLRCNN